MNVICFCGAHAVEKKKELHCQDETVTFSLSNVLTDTRSDRCTTYSVLREMFFFRKCVT